MPSRDIPVGGAEEDAPEDAKGSLKAVKGKFDRVPSGVMDVAGQYEVLEDVAAGRPKMGSSLFRQLVRLDPRDRFCDSLYVFAFLLVGHPRPATPTGDA